MTNYNIVYSDTLQHHGVKGMKWGVRKERIATGLRNVRKNISKLANIQGTQARRNISSYAMRKTNEWRQTNQRKSSNAVTIAGGWALRNIGRKFAYGFLAGGIGTAVGIVALNKPEHVSTIATGANVALKILNAGYIYNTAKDTYNTVGRLSTHLSDKYKNNKNNKNKK